MEEDVVLGINLPKVPDIEMVAIEALDRMGGYFGISPEKLGEARIAVTEAIVNAFEHGARGNNNVNIEFRMTKEKLTVVVTDYGKGFKPENVADPDIKKKIGTDHKRGWGLKLMKSMSDNLIIESGPSGTRISITKNLV